MKWMVCVCLDICTLQCTTTTTNKHIGIEKARDRKQNCSSFWLIHRAYAHNYKNLVDICENEIEFTMEKVLYFRRIRMYYKFDMILQ